MRSRIFWRLFLIQLVLLSVCAVVVTLLLDTALRKNYTTEAAARIKQGAKSLQIQTERLLGKNDIDGVRQRITQASRAMDARICLVLNERQVLVESVSGRQIYPTADSSSPKECVADLTNRDVCLGLPIRVGNYKGVIRIAVSEEYLEGRMKGVHLRILLAVCLTTLLALVLCLLAVRSISEPIGRLVHVADSISRGDFDEPATVPVRKDEIGVLAAKIENMRQRLKQNIEALKRERNEMATILGGMVEGVIAIDQDHRVLLVNEAARQMFEGETPLKPGEPLGLIAENEKLAALVQMTMHDERPHTKEISLGGGKRFFHVCVAPLIIDSMSGAVLVFDEVTDLRRLSKAREDLVTYVSHEIRTPLASIRACAETICRQVQNNEKITSFCAMLTRNVERLNGLVTGVLTLSNLEAKAADASLGRVDFGLLVENITFSLRPAATAKHVELAAETSVGTYFVWGNENLLERMVSSLVDNAIKYTLPGGRVDVEVAVEERNVVLRVRDTGIGIPAEEREHVWERFYRGKASAEQLADGSGLGLTIVRHVVEAHGGHAEILDNKPKGTCFVVKLPKAEDKKSES